MDETVALLERAQAVAHVGCWGVDLRASTRVIWSAETYRIHGVSFDDQPPTEALHAFVDPEDNDAARRAAKAAIENGAVYDTEHRVVGGDGGIRWVHQRADGVRDADGTPATGLGLARACGMMKQSGGFLYVDTELGRGTAFSIYLPPATPSELQRVIGEVLAAARPS